MTSASKHSIAVIGSGVIGLTGAICLQEQGFPVTIYARETPPRTTSDVAAAYWAPGAALAGGRLRQWALASLAALHALADRNDSGVTINHLYELSAEPGAGLHPALPVRAEMVPPGVFPTPWAGVRVTVPQIDVPVYMPWLFQRFQALGGQVQRVELQRLDELAGRHQVVVNCSGLGAQRLTGDPMFPIRGQVIRVSKPPGLLPDMITAEAHSEVTYIIPRSQDCLLGGTYHYGDARTEIDEEIAAGILARCAQFNPALRDPAIIEHRVGLRPGRRQVRLEVERFNDDVIVIHNYGHAALGHTLAWGCAEEVVALLQKALRA